MSAKPCILVVDDEPETLELVSLHLRQAGFEVLTAEDGAAALEKARARLPQLIVLDLMLPETDGLEVCKRLRRDPATAGIPILMLTARATEVDRVLGLELGADDYVTKPFSPRELVLRVRKLLERKGPGEPAEVLQFEDLVIDVPAHQVTVAGPVGDLAATGVKLVAPPAPPPRRVQSRGQLVRDGRGYAPAGGTRPGDAPMRRPREEESAGAHPLGTVRGVGYRFAP